MSDRTDFNRHQKEKAISAESWATSDFWDNVAFVQRYGTTEEVHKRGMELGAFISWWSQLGPSLSPEDLEAVRHLEAALDRLREVYTTAEITESHLSKAGYGFDEKTRLVKETATGRRGPKRTLLSKTVVSVFDELPEEWGRINSADVRVEVRRILLERFHPDLLGVEAGQRIHSAINSALNP